METQNVLYPDAKILIIDDDVDVLESLSANLRLTGYHNVESLHDGRLAMEKLGEGHCACILLDLMMPLIPGKVLLEKIEENFPHIPVIVITAIDDIEMVISCMRAGAYDYLVKPIRLQRLLTTVENTIRYKSMGDEKLSLTKSLLEKGSQEHEAFKEIITHHTRMKSVFSYIEVIADTPYPVLLTGESGTGKGMIAKGLHKLSKCHGKFVSINVAGLDDTLFSDTLFGHKKGAFTGADSDREGLLSKAENGVVFLDEIGDLEMSSQIKLLRLLQDREYNPLGFDKLRTTNAKFVLATNRNLEKLISEGKFRYDLFYRISTHSAHIPPLKERKEDLPFLVKHFIRKHAKILGKQALDYRPQLLETLSHYSFPGNVRELENLISDAVAVSKGRFISMETIEKNIKIKPLKQSGNSSTSSLEPSQGPEPVLSLKEAEDKHIASVLSIANNNLSLTARLLKINYSTLHRKLKKVREEQS